MTQVVVRPCWRVYGWNKGRWTQRSTHPSPEAAASAAKVLATSGVRVEVRQQQRRTIEMSEQYQGAAKTFRQQQADKMVVKRQAHTYFKSGCNGTEILAKEDA